MLNNTIHLKALLILLVLLTGNAGFTQSLAINEIMTSNGSTMADEDGDYEDWIELYNYGAEAISLAGYGLTDDESNLFRWVFPNVTINPGEYLIVWASGKDRRPNQGDLNPGISRQVYGGIPGVYVSDLTNHPSYPDNPTSTNIVTQLFEAPVNVGDYYGQRIHGWIKPPATGAYVFWISGDDYSELHLSTSANPQNAVMISNVPGWTDPRQWNKYPQQQSTPKLLQEGQYYYIMALMKEHDGGDNLAIGWQRPGSILERPISGQYLFREEAQLHTNFSIKAAGEKVLITSPSGTIIDQVQPVVLTTDISYGRSPDGAGNFFFFDQPTPSQSNATQTYSEILDPPVFSQNGGFYTQGFSLSVSHTDPTATIIYTIDGSVPSPSNLTGKTYQFKNSYPEQSGQSFGPFLTNSYQSYIYTSPIGIADRSAAPDKLTKISSTWHYSPYYFPSTAVSKGTVVRAIAVKDGAIPSLIASNTYFVFPNGREKYSLPVVSISVQENSFFDYENGIYVAGKDFDTWRSNNPGGGGANGGTPSNYWREGDEWEYPGHIEIFPSSSDTAILSHGLGLRIHGGWSRSFPNKSLRLYAKNKYGAETFDYAVFPGNPDDSFKRLLLRNSGNDADNTLFRDAAIQEIVEGLSFDTQDYQPAILFVNGEFWGIHNFRERFDKYYLERVYGVDPENVDILEFNASVKEGNADHYLAMRTYMETNNISLPEHYNYIKTQMDVDNFTDYNIAQIFAANTDWPGNNIDYWRLNTDGYVPNAPLGHDGRWRWMMFDTDFGFGLYGGSYTSNTLTFATEPNGPDWPNPPWSTYLLRRLLTNQEFKLNFINRFADLLNTTYIPARTTEIINSMKQAISPEIPAHIHRWKAPSSVATWNNNVNVMTTFVSQRPTYQWQHIRQYFGISSNINVTLDVDNAEMGYIRINTIKITLGTPGVVEQPYPWTGIYFHNIPVQAEAIAKPGFVFSHWEGSSSSSEPVINITPLANIALKAHFTEIELPDTEIIHYWHFNDLPTGTLTSVQTDYSFPGQTPGIITYPGTGAGYMDRRTHSVDDPVSNLNLLMGQLPDQGAVLRVRNPSDTRELIIAASSYGFENIQAVFATTRTSNGATEQEFFYSTDAGANWILIEPAYIIPQLPEWMLKVIDLSDIPEADNNHGLHFRIMFGGENAGGPAGNDRFDNFSVHGELLPAALLGVDPETAAQGVTVDVTIIAEHTFWTAQNPDVFMVYTGSPPLIFEAGNITVSENTELTATFEIPSGAPTGLYNMHVDNLILLDAFTVTLTSGLIEPQTSTQFYPNPARNEVHFAAGESNTESVLVIVSDIKGVIVAQENFVSGTTLNTSKFKPGVYFVKIRTNNTQEVRKLVIK